MVPYHGNVDSNCCQVQLETPTFLHYTLKNVKKERASNSGPRDNEVIKNKKLNPVLTNSLNGGLNTKEIPEVTEVDDTLRPFWILAAFGRVQHCTLGLYMSPFMA